MLSAHSRDIYPARRGYGPSRISDPGHPLLILIQLPSGNGGAKALTGHQNGATCFEPCKGTGSDIQAVDRNEQKKTVKAV